MYHYRSSHPSTDDDIKTKRYIGKYIKDQKIKHKQEEIENERIDEKYYRGGRARLNRKGKDDGENGRKGFTLVELIVVIVILAILAAILIPGLLKWIDEAKKKRYELEVKNIYTAGDMLIAKWLGEGKIGIDEVMGNSVYDVGYYYKTGIPDSPENSDDEDNFNGIRLLREMSGVNVVFAKLEVYKGSLVYVETVFESSDGSKMYGELYDNRIELNKMGDENDEWEDL